MDKLSELNMLLLNLIRLHHKRACMISEKLGIHLSHPIALFFISKFNGLSQKELADILRIKPASITVMLQRMEKEQLVKRSVDKNDQRITRVFITEKGKTELEFEIEALNTLEDDSFKLLDEENKAKLYQILLLINRSLSESCGEDSYINEQFLRKDGLNDKLT